MIEAEFVLRIITLLTQIIVLILCIYLCLDYKGRADEIDEIDDRLRKLEAELKQKEMEDNNAENHETE